MTLAEFDAEPLTTNADGAIVVKEVPFDEVCTYILDGTDSKTSHLLAGLWLSREVFTKEQMFKAVLCALFPRRGYMRWAASTYAMRLAKAAGCERELQVVVQERWSSITERESNGIVLGLSSEDDNAGWMPALPVLFELNKSNDIRTQLVRVVHYKSQATEKPDDRRLLDTFLRQMPVKREAYSNPTNFQFIKNLQSSAARR
jgi:hypothetical protein